MIISRCKDLTLDKFIDCLVNNNLACLSDEPQTDDALAVAWDFIWNEYLTLIDLPNHKYVTELIRSIALLYLKLNVVEWNVKALQNGYYPECVKALKDVGMAYKFDIEDPLQYSSDLESCLKKAKSWVIEYQQRQREYDEYQKTTKKNPITEAGFMDNIVSLSKIMGFRVDPKSVTVAEYCSIMKIAVNNG